MFDDLYVICRKCTKKVHPSELRKENPNSEIMICSSCFDKLKEVSNSLEEIEKEIKDSKEEKLQYCCEACGFRFTRNKGLLNKNCPYCSKDAVKQINVNLVKEVKDF